MKSLAILSLLLAAAPAATQTPPKPALDELAFITGHWCTGEGKIEEIWMAPQRGLMLGINRDGRREPPFFEYLRIVENDDGIVYFASPLGREATPFALTESGPGRAVFTNPEHDFPQRIEYERKGDSLVARISGAEGSPGEWRFTACSSP